MIPQSYTHLLPCALAVAFQQGHVFMMTKKTKKLPDSFCFVCFFFRFFGFFFFFFWSNSTNMVLSELDMNLAARNPSHMLCRRCLRAGIEAS